MAVAMGQLIQKAREQLGDMTGLELGSTLSARKEGDVWKVQIEVLEKKSLPDSMDILATYELTMGDDAGVVNFERLRMRKRIDVMVPEGAESEV